MLTRCWIVEYIHLQCDSVSITSGSRHALDMIKNYKQNSCTVNSFLLLQYVDKLPAVNVTESS